MELKINCPCCGSQIAISVTTSGGGGGGAQDHAPEVYQLFPDGGWAVAASGGAGGAAIPRCYGCAQSWPKDKDGLHIGPDGGRGACFADQPSPP